MQSIHKIFAKRTVHVQYVESLQRENVQVVTIFSPFCTYCTTWCEMQ